KLSNLLSVQFQSLQFDRMKVQCLKLACDRLRVEGMAFVRACDVRQVKATDCLVSVHSAAECFHDDRIAHARGKGYLPHPRVALVINGADPLQSSPLARSG